VNQNHVTGTSKVVRRAAARVVRRSKRDGTRVRAGTEVHQLFGSDGTHPGVCVHTQYARQIAPHVRRAQQPGCRVGPVADRPAQWADPNAIQVLAPLLDHLRTTGGLAQAEHPAQRRTRRVRTDVGLGRSDCRGPVLVAGKRVRPGASRPLRRRVRGEASRLGYALRQRRPSVALTGPTLPRFSILGRRKIAWPGSRSFSRSHIRCQACRPSSVTGTDAVVKGGVR
jgi:hypothetical protein